ncbi:MAG TPA: hypothetical protein VLB51_09680, partial [Methylomirabilota bacterium]|nr:hypothetical protein [Methylomirabilota bacterium]
GHRRNEPSQKRAIADIATIAFNAEDAETIAPSQKRAIATIAVYGGYGYVIGIAGDHRRAAAATIKFLRVSVSS